MSGEKNKTKRGKAKNPKPAENPAGKRNFLEESQVAILALIVAVLFYLLWQCRDIQPLPAWDGTYYMRYSLDSIFPPVYPFFIIMARSFVSPEVLAARFVSMALLCGTVILVFYLAKYFTSTIWAFSAAIFTGFAPLSLRLGTDTLSEATYVFFITLAAYLYVRTIKDGNHKWELLSCGISSAMAFFTRPEAAVFFIVLLAIDAFKRRRMRRIAMMVGGFAAIFIVMTAIVYVGTGELVITKKTSNFRIMSPTDWLKNEELKTGRPMPPPSFGVMANSILANYGDNFKQEGSNLITFAGVPALLLCLWYLFKRRTFLVAGLAEFFVYPIFTGLAVPQRFVYPYIPFIGIMAAAAISEFVPSKIRGPAVLLVLAGTLTGLPFLTTVSEPYPEQEAAGIVLKPYVNDSTIILDKKPYSTFFAGLGPKNYEEIPFQSIEGTIDYAEQTHANYLVLDRPVIQVLRPQLYPLFNPQVRAQYASKLQLFKDIYPGAEYEVLVFRVL